MRRAALYLRSSKDRHDISLDAQRRELTGLAQSRGLVVVEEFSDAVESGSTDQRPGFQALICALKDRARKWTVVLALDTSRIARRRYIAEAFRHECRKLGVDIVFAKVPEVDPISQVILDSVLQAMDEVHSLMSREKGMAGMAENVRQGYRAGGRAPYGYRLEHIETGAMRDGAPVTKSRLVQDAATGPGIAAYLKARARGTPAVRAAEQAGIALTSSGLVGIEWNALTYAGHTVWGQLSERPGQPKRRPRAEWIIQRDTHEPLISDAEAEAILARLEAGRAKRYAKPKAAYLLSGVLESPDGTPWHGNAGNYRCGRKNIKAEVVDRSIMERIAADLLSPAFIHSILAKAKDAAAPGGEARQLEKIEQDIAALDRQTSRLTDLLTETTSPDALLRKIEKIEADRGRLIERAEAVREEAHRAQELRRVKESDVRVMLAGLAEDMPAMPPELLGDFVRGLTERITLDPSTFQGEIHYRIAVSSGELMASPRGFEPRLPP